MAQDAEFDEPEQPVEREKRPTKGPTVAQRAEAAQQRAQGQEPAKANEPKAAIIALVERAPADVLKSEENRAALYAHIEGEIAAFVPNLETGVGRKAVAALAYKITRTKTALDEAGKELNAELRKRIDAVDEVRRGAREKLDELADRARKPLTDWEEAEKRREDAYNAIIAELNGRIDPLATSVDLTNMIKDIGELVIDPEVIGEEAAEMLRTKRDDLIADLVLTKERTLRAEEDAEERRRLQAIADQAEADRREREAEDQRRAQQEEDRRRDEERREQNDKHIRECAERAGEARGLFKVAESAPATEELMDQVAAVRTDGALVGPDNSNELSHWKERIMRRIRQELYQAAQETRRQEAAAADETAKRAARTKLRNAIMELGAEKELAGKIALAIVAGSLPHVSINYEPEN
jgi:colicin import membrane protein